MENSFLNFIGYESQDFFPKIEMGLEECPVFSSQRDEGPLGFSFENDSHNMNYSNHKASNLIHNIFDAAFNHNPSNNIFEKPRKLLPFKIIRQEKPEKKEESSTSDETSINVPIIDKIADKSRRIIKREKAKQRNSAKSLVLTPSVSVAEIPQKYLPEGSAAINCDDKSKKKMVQMIRNRISAQNSRDRKKAYMKRLEAHQKKMAAENSQYQKEIIQLKQANEALKLECEYLRRCLMSTIGDSHDKVYQHEEFEKEVLVSEECRQDLANVGSRICLRKINNSAHLIKYTLTLATLFAVLMFSNISLQNGSLEPKLSQLGQQLSKLESQLEDAFYSYKTKLEEEDSLQTSELHKDSDHMKIEIEDDQQGLLSATKPVRLHEIDELRKLRDQFNEEYMPKIINQFKVNTSEELNMQRSMSLPQYMKQSLEQSSNFNGADSFLDSNYIRDNQAALFCPSGFMVQSSHKEPNNFSLNVKLEEGFQYDSKIQNGFS